MNEIFQWMFNPENDKVIILMRGVPSSGKSYRAKELSKGDASIICSADHYFGSTPEEYVSNWSVEKLGAAHKLCQKNSRMMMQRQVPLVIVDNTNTLIRDMMPYFEMAVQYQYRILIEEPTSSWWLQIVPLLREKQKNEKAIKDHAKALAEKSMKTHNVPYASIEKMLMRYMTDVTPEQLAKVYERSIC